jgi:hypothetical protein
VIDPPKYFNIFYFMVGSYIVVIIAKEERVFDGKETKLRPRRGF